MIKRPFGAIVALYLTAILVVAIAVDRFGDAWWPATALMFAPRWAWAVPLAVLVPLAARRQREALVPLAVAAILVLFPILDLRIPVWRLGRLGGRPRDLRVMTYNVGAGVNLGGSFTSMVVESGADIVAIQEREGAFRLSAMSVHCRAGMCLGSRFPIRRSDARDPADFLAIGGSGVMVRHEIETPRGKIDVTNVHLATVRDGLSHVLRRGPRGAGALVENTRVRRLEAEAARSFARGGSNPVLVLGDFNMPVESAVYRASWSSFENAYSTVGFGFGATKTTGWHGVRIDHVLVGPGLEVLRCWVGSSLGGDHRPVIADIRFVEKGSRRESQ